MGRSNDSNGPAEPASEKRSAHRKRTLKRGKVVLTDWAAIDCTFRDLTAEGAHLVFGGPVALPQEFRLENVSDATIVPVRLEWQRGLEAGVTFTGPAEPIHTLKR